MIHSQSLPLSVVLTGFTGITDGKMVDFFKHVVLALEVAVLFKILKLLI